MPPDASVDDGLTSQEAVAIALWNSPSFQATLADLGIARADLVEAGLLRNPVFSLLFPWWPQAARMDAAVSLRRPLATTATRRRGQLNAQAVGERLVWDALTLVAQARAAHAEAVIADRRLQLTIENADLVQRLAGITEARLRAGDISELEARSARSDAARVQVVRRAVEHDRNLARLTLAATIGLDLVGEQLRPVPERGGRPDRVRHRSRATRGCARLAPGRACRGDWHRGGGATSAMGAFSGAHPDRDSRRQWTRGRGVRSSDPA